VTRVVRLQFDFSPPVTCTFVPILRAREH